MSPSDEHRIETLAKIQVESDQIAKSLGDMHADYLSASLAGGPDAAGKYQGYEVAVLRLRANRSSLQFDNPLQWLVFKTRHFESFGNPIKTLNDIRMHANFTDCLCSKRFNFLYNAYYDHFDQNFFKSYSQDIYVDELINTTSLNHEITNPSIVMLWLNFEYEASPWSSYAAK